MTAVQLQKSVKLAAASKALASFRVNVEKPCGEQPAVDVEDVPLRYDYRRVRALHAASEG